MTENIEDVVADININKLLIAILEQVKEITVPALSIIEAGNVDKELVLKYEEEPPSFIITLRDKNDGNAN